MLARVDRLLESFEIGHVTLTGGEPLAFPAVLEVIDRFSAAGIVVQLISNGGLVDAKLAQQLAERRVRSLQITLNGSTAALHEEHVGAGHFERTLSGIRALRAAGVTVVGCVVVTRKNAADVGRILELWKSLGVSSIALSRFSPAGYAANHAAALLPGRDDLIRAFELAAPFAREGMSIKCTMPVPPCAIEVERFPEIGFGTCPIGTENQEFALGPDGKLRNCTLHRQAIGGVDDILELDDLTSLLRAPEVTQYRRELPEFCTGCVHQHTCGGGCGAASEWVLGHARRYPDPFVWQYMDDEFASELAQQDEQGRTHLATLS